LIVLIVHSGRDAAAPERNEAIMFNCWATSKREAAATVFVAAPHQRPPSVEYRRHSARNEK